MGTTIDEIQRWAEEGIKSGKSHLIVMCDTFDHRDFPLYLHTDEKGARQIAEMEGKKSMQRVMEVYNLKMDLEPQLSAIRSFNY
jgi:hypothetical protein